MPHVRALFPENAAVRKFLEKNKTRIRQIVADETGYDVKLIAFVPEPIRKRNRKISENLTALELIPEVGKKVKTETEAETLSGRIKSKISSKCPGAKTVNFGVWIRAYPVNGYSEHKPAKKKR